jgi:hypothetical protein
MDTIWTKPKFTKADLDHKTVEFQIPTRGGILKRIAEFRVYQNPDGELAVDIMTDVQEKHRAEHIQNIYHLPLVGVERIKKHPDPTVADFRLVMTGT